MKILWVIPHEFEVVGGGAWNQVNSMFKEFQILTKDNKINIIVDFLRPGVNIKDYDLVHLFRSDPSLHNLTLYLKGQNIPYWITPIFYSDKSPTLIKAQIQLGRMSEQVFSGWKNQFQTAQEMILGATKVLPNTQAEGQLLVDSMKLPSNQIEILHNGIHPEFFEDFQSDDETHFKEYDISTGMFGNPRKNTLNLLKAYNKTHGKGKNARNLILVGSFSQGSYSRQCRNLISQSDNIKHFPSMDSKSVDYKQLISKASYFVMPSLFETPGLAALEACALKTQVVITAFGGTREYFQENAAYFEDLSFGGIYRTITALPKNKISLRNPEAFEIYKWNHVVKDLLEVYLRYLS